MNCKPGDLAVVVKSHAGNEGKIVRCLRLATNEEIDRYNHDNRCGPVWLIDQNIPRTWTPAPLAKDVNLRPIRDPGPDAVDESLTWKPVPFPQVETA